MPAHPRLAYASVCFSHLAYASACFLHLAYVLAYFLWLAYASASFFVLENYVIYLWDSQMLFIMRFTKARNNIFSIFGAEARHFSQLCCIYQIVSYEKTTFQALNTRKYPNYSEKSCKMHAFYARNYNICVSQTFSASS